MDQAGTDVRSRRESVTDPPPREVWAFAGYIFDVDACSLTLAGGSPVVLTRGELALLRAFVQRPGRVLSRDFLLDAVAGRRADPFDRSIDVQVGRLRRKIESDPKQPALIVTVPGEGYKFVAPLSKAQPAPASLPPALPEAPPGWLRRGLLAMAGAGGAAALGGAAGWWVWPRGPLRQDEPGVLVMPFENFSGDPSRQYLAAGVTIDLRTMLGTFPGIRVISAPPESDKSLPTIRQAAQQAGARYVVTGGVLRAAERIRIVAQMYGAEGDVALWAGRYDVSSTNALGPQEDVANRIFDSLAGTTGRIKREEMRIAWRRAAPELDEYDYYLRCHAMHMDFTLDGNRKAQAICAEGLARFPDSALLRVMMGFTHNWRVMSLVSDNPAADIEATWRLAKEARALSPRSLLVTWKLHWLMAFADQWHDQNFSGSVEEARAAVALVPYDPFSLNDLSCIMANAGYFEEAIQWARLGIDHDPGGPSWYRANLVWAYYLAGRYKEALAVNLRPEAAPDIFVSLYMRVGRMEDARRMVAVAIRNAPKDSVAMQALFPLIEPHRSAFLNDLRRAGLRERA